MNSESQNQIFPPVTSLSQHTVTISLVTKSFCSSLFSLFSILSIDVSLQALCLYDYMKDYAGSSLFVLFKAIKFQVTIWQSDNLYLVSQKPTELTSLAPVGRTLSIACDPVATNNHLSIHQLDFPQSFCKSEIISLSAYQIYRAGKSFTARVFSRVGRGKYCARWIYITGEKTADEDSSCKNIESSQDSSDVVL